MEFCRPDLRLGETPHKVFSVEEFGRMRIHIERTFLTTAAGTRVIDARPEQHIVQATNLSRALIQFITEDDARLLGTITERDGRAVATAWKDRLYLVMAEFGTN